MRHGHGYRYYAKGLKYKGQWVNNEKSGTGSMLWDNNDVTIYKSIKFTIVHLNTDSNY